MRIGIVTLCLNANYGGILQAYALAEVLRRMGHDAVQLQPNLLHPSEIHPLRQTFEEDYAKHGFLYVARKYGDMGWRYRVKLLKRKCRTAIRLILKR